MNIIYKSQNKKTHTFGILFIICIVGLYLLDIPNKMELLAFIIALELPILAMTLRSGLGRTPHANERFY